MTTGGLSRPPVDWLAVLASRVLRFRKLRQPLASRRLTQLQEAARFDLPDALARDAVGPGHLFQRPRLAVTQAETNLDYLALTRRQGPQHLADALAQQVQVHGCAGVVGVAVVEEVRSEERRVGK